MGFGRGPSLIKDCFDRGQVAQPVFEQYNNSSFLANCSRSVLRQLMFHLSSRSSVRSLVDCPVSDGQSDHIGSLTNSGLLYVLIPLFEQLEKDHRTCGAGSYRRRDIHIFNNNCIWRRTLGGGQPVQSIIWIRARLPASYLILGSMVRDKLDVTTLCRSIGSSTRRNGYLA